MSRLSVSRIFMGVSLVAILVALSQSGGCGRRFTMVECVSFSADGSRIAVSKLNARDARTPLKFYKADVSRTVSVIDSRNGSAVAVVQQDFKLGNCGPAFGLWRVGRTSALFNPLNDSVLAHEFGGGNLKQYAINSESKPNVLDLEHTAVNIAVSPSGRLVAASGDYQLTILETSTGRLAMNAQAADMPFLHAALLAFSADESRLFVGNNEGVSVWDIATGKKTSMVIQDLKPWIKSIAAAPDDTLLICSDEWCRRYDLSGKVVSTLASSGYNYACCVSRNGKNAAVLTDDKVVIYDVLTGKETSSAPVDFATTVALSPDGDSIAVGDCRGNVSLIDVRTGKRRWSSSPPGQQTWSWTLPAIFLAGWGFIVWVMWTKAVASGRHSHDVVHRGD